MNIKKTDFPQYHNDYNRQNLSDSHPILLTWQCIFIKKNTIDGQAFKPSNIDPLRNTALSSGIQILGNTLVPKLYTQL